MATERLIEEINTGNVPIIDPGNFFFRPAEKPSAPSSRAPTAAATKPDQKKIAQQFLGTSAAEFETPPPLEDTEFPLNLLQKKTFAGTGYNVVWRPKSAVPLDGIKTGPLPDDLQLNLTAETMTFSGSIGDVPNRGADSQPDIRLKGISYVQRVGGFENVGRNGKTEPDGIHWEPGVLMFVPASQKQDATINRMGSIPHGTTINAQGIAPKASEMRQMNAKQDIEAASIVPFRASKDTAAKPLFFKNDPFPTPFTQLNFNGFTGAEQKNRLPNPLDEDHRSKPQASEIITEQVLRDPNQILRTALLDQEVESFTSFTLTTEAVNDFTRPKKEDLAPGTLSQKDDKFTGGGTANIGFLQGTDDRSKFDSARGNAHAIRMIVKYWIEKVAGNFTIEPNKNEAQEFQMVSAAGVLGPTYVVSAALSKKLTAPLKKRKTWTQIQYSQNVTLLFSTLGWPHISVATLGDTSRIDLTEADMS